MITKFNNTNESVSSNFIDNCKNHLFNITIYTKDSYGNLGKEIENRYKFISTGYNLMSEWIMELFILKFKTKSFTKRNISYIDANKVLLIPNETHEKLEELLESEGFILDHRGRYQKELSYAGCLKLMELIDSTF